MSLVGIVSDTHGHISNDVLAALSGVDHIIHAGDMGTPLVLTELEALAPVTAVLGNNDHSFDFGPGVKESATEIIDGVRLFVSHYPRDAERAADSGKYDLAIHGHTHVPRDEVRGECRIINPGGAFRPRGGSHRQLVLIELEDGKIGPARAIRVN